MCRIFLESQRSQNFEVKCVFWPVAWNSSGPRTNPYVKFFYLSCVCVLMMWSDWGWSFVEGANLYFSSGTKNRVFWHYQVEKAVWYKLMRILHVYTYRHYPSICPHDLETCDSRFSFLKLYSSLNNMQSWEMVWFIAGLFESV